ncbi:NAD-dependent epimerase/dehydratase family protein [Rosistilla oblonga]|uniref:dTDP-glucose 4,6-dehydratase n=1 Tax=Rosistilla oblonga TaxID=2527990 RepID=A0A518IQ34_9BACT|nr:NAD-dependent epimerase/dehydratase family protein [Rosistilla oblonga]QDV55209.1 dTDP-glucose 4,6-dehydratase [Rosistilla oblonga]
MKRVLVTGANGFVGRYACKYLQAAGWQVRGTIRNQDSTGLPESVEPLVIGDIAAFDHWEKALKGVDAVVHLVARTHVIHEKSTDPLPLYRKVNVDGTQRLIDGCRGASVKRFLFVSSIKAVGESSTTSLTETDVCEPEDAYGVSKLEAEQIVASAAALSMETVILRPPLIYGPGVLGNFQRILKAVDRGLPLPLRGTTNQRSLLYVENFAAAIAVCLEHPAAANQTFHLADSEPVSSGDLVRQISLALGCKPRLVPFPVPLLRMLGTIARKQDQVSRLVDSLTVSTSKIEHATGWQPEFTLCQGLAATAQHYRAA